MSKLSVIILSFNTSELTARAVTSALDGCYNDLQVVVVDNHSSDDTLSRLREIKDKRLKIIARDVNDGFAAGNNVAIKLVRTPYFMLLNSDAYFDENGDLGTAIKYLDDNPNIGVLSPFVVLQSGKIDPASHRGFPTPWNAFCYYTKLEKILGFMPAFGGYHQTWKNLKISHEIDACTGAAMIVRTTALENVGLLDEQFFMYGEDLDWCFRFKAAGFKIMFYPWFVVHHDKHTSGLKHKTHKSRTRDAFYDAMKLFYHKHYAHTYPKWLQALTFSGIELVKKFL